MNGGTGGADEALRGLKLAMETEKYGLRAYLGFARGTRDETGKNMFIILARDELDHLEILERAAAEFEGSGSWAGIEVPRSLVEQVAPRLRERDVRVKGKKGIDQIQALNAALDQERKAAELYRGLMAKAAGAGARKTFQKLLEMEEAHYEIIQAELDSITDTGFWFQIPEFNLEEEPT